MCARRFSIVITCHNQRDFIRAALESALSQASDLREVIVVDDASTDGSVEILQQYSDKVQLLCLPSNRGAIEARNEGLARAKGQYVTFLDGDDVMMPWALDVYERIAQDRAPKLVLASMVPFTGEIPWALCEEEPRAIELVEYEALMHRDRRVGLLGGACVVERQTLEAMGGWTPGIFHCDSQDLFTKLGYAGRTILICAPATVFYRMHPSNTTNTWAPFVQMQYRLMAKERRGEYPGGREHLFERRSWIGDKVVFCIRRALRARLYKDAIKLAVSGWSMILVAVLRRLTLLLRKRHPLETLKFHSAKSTTCEPAGGKSENRHSYIGG